MAMMKSQRQFSPEHRASSNWTCVSHLDENISIYPWDSLDERRQKVARDGAMPFVS